MLTAAEQAEAGRSWVLLEHVHLRTELFLLFLTGLILLLVPFVPIPKHRAIAQDRD